MNNLLEEEGYRRLPCPVANNSQKDWELQRKLQDIVKKEEMEKKQRAFGDATDAELEYLNPLPDSFLDISQQASTSRSTGILKTKINKTKPRPSQDQENTGPSGRNISFGQDDIHFIPGITRYNGMCR